MVRLINTVARVLCGALYGGSPTRDPGQNFPRRRFVASHDRNRLEQQLTENFHGVGGGVNIWTSNFQRWYYPVNMVAINKDLRRMVSGAEHKQQPGK